MSRGVRGRAELPADPPCARVDVRLGPICEPFSPAMPSDDMCRAWRGDACGGLAGSLPVVALLPSAVDFERGGSGVLVLVVCGGADRGETGEVGGKLGYGFIGVS